ncbi:hypothetical protein ACWEO4_35435 [Streptomyces sp. NPDC004393]
MFNQASVCELEVFPMRRRTRATAVAAALSATLLAGSGMASATSTATKAAVQPCTTNNVSFYFGGYSYGLGQRRFDLTLLAHDGITCGLSDTLLITVSSPPDETKKVPVTVNGRGGTLVLRTDSPLHATIFYSAPDTQADKREVQRPHARHARRDQPRDELPLPRHDRHLQVRCVRHVLGDRYRHGPGRGALKALTAGI